MHYEKREDSYYVHCHHCGSTFEVEYQGRLLANMEYCLFCGHKFEEKIEVELCFGCPDVSQCIERHKKILKNLS